LNTKTAGDHGLQGGRHTHRVVQNRAKALRLNCRDPERLSGAPLARELCIRPIGVGVEILCRVQRQSEIFEHVAFRPCFPAPFDAEISAGKSMVGISESSTAPCATPVLAAIKRRRYRHGFCIHLRQAGAARSGFFRRGIAGHRKRVAICRNAASDVMISIRHRIVGRTDSAPTGWPPPKLGAIPASSSIDFRFETSHNRPKQGRRQAHAALIPLVLPDPGRPWEIRAEGQRLAARDRAQATAGQSANTGA